MGKSKKPVDPAAVKAKAGRASQKFAKGHMSPTKAAKNRHGAHVVLGEMDSTYHGCSK